MVVNACTASDDAEGVYAGCLDSYLKVQPVCVSLSPWGFGSADYIDSEGVYEYWKVDGCVC